MSLTIELPPATEEALSREANREGVPTSVLEGHILCVVSALGEGDFEGTLAQTVHDHFKARSINSGHVATAFQDLVSLLEKGCQDLALTAEGTEGRPSPPSPVESPSQDLGPAQRPSLRGKYAGIGLSSYNFMREKQEEIAREERRFSD